MTLRVMQPSESRLYLCSPPLVHSSNREQLVLLPSAMVDFSSTSLSQFVPEDPFDYLKDYQRVEVYDKDKTYEASYVDGDEYEWRPEPQSL